MATMGLSASLPAQSPARASIHNIGLVYSARGTRRERSNTDDGGGGEARQGEQHPPARRRERRAPHPPATPPHPAGSEPNTPAGRGRPTVPLHPAPGALLPKCVPAFLFGKVSSLYRRATPPGDPGNRAWRERGGGPNFRAGEFATGRCMARPCRWTAQAAGAISGRASGCGAATAHEIPIATAQRGDRGGGV
jgi:hypothetical protein